MVEWQLHVKVVLHVIFPTAITRPFLMYCGSGVFHVFLADPLETLTGTTAAGNCLLHDCFEVSDGVKCLRIDLAI